MPKSEVDLSSGWGVIQDVHELGEKLGVFRREWNPQEVLHCFSPWEPIKRLDYLQRLFASQPYFGKELRHFNTSPWFYRLEFAAPADVKGATLRFEGVDYYAKVWLNETLLGEHEGHTDPFEFEVGHLLDQAKPNVLVVKVWSPWDTQIVPNQEKMRFWYVLRTMFKGSYEHADTFVQRDVNPVGIWRPVKLIVHEGLRTSQPVVTAKPIDNGSKADIRFAWPVTLDAGSVHADLTVRVLSPNDSREVACSSTPVELVAGKNQLSLAMKLESPLLWSTWDRGGPNVYQARLEIAQAGRPLLCESVTFGIRDVDIRRNKDEVTFLLNGKPIYLRGATYWPDLYVSACDRARYERDVEAAIRAGINALRIHVHVENDEFYEVCDRLGMLVFQDFELTWAFPTTEEFTSRAVQLFGAMIRRLRNHPSVGCWICMNEATGDMNFANKSAGGTDPLIRPGTELVAEARRLDPDRPTIKNSGSRDDLESGDGHDYSGSLNGGQFLDIFGKKEKMATEFGADAPPAPERARMVPAIADRLGDVLPRVAELHDYQYHLLKYYMEHYRIQKYAPCSGYFQFMFIDFCPQSFYGVYDYWGYPKSEGIGGGLQAMQESNQPVGIFMEYKDAPIALHAVNDLMSDLGQCEARWEVTLPGGQLLASGKESLKLGPDSLQRVCDFHPPIEKGQACDISLTLVTAAGKVIARNTYRNPFNPPARPEGYPQRMDHEVGMRLWWAGLKGK